MEAAEGAWRAGFVRRKNFGLPLSQVGVSEAGSLGYSMKITKR